MNTNMIYSSDVNRGAYVASFDGDVVRVDIEAHQSMNEVKITFADGRVLTVETVMSYDIMSTDVYETPPSTEPKAESVHTICGLMAPDALMNCTLAPLHDGDHEAHGPAPEHRLCHSWHA